MISLCVDLQIIKFISPFPLSTEQRSVIISVEHNTKCTDMRYLFTPKPTILDPSHTGLPVTLVPCVQLFLGVIKRGVETDVKHCI